MSPKYETIHKWQKIFKLSAVQFSPARTTKSETQKFINREQNFSWKNAKMAKASSNKSLGQDLRNLSRIYAPSRDERGSAKYMEQALKGYVDESSIDDMNNYVGIKRGKRAKRTVLIDAHVDEVPRANPKLSPRLQGNIFSGKALDDRSGCAAMIEIAKQLSDYEELNLIYVGAAQEELGKRGAEKLAKEMKARGETVDLAIAIDVIDCYEKRTKTNKLGEGVVLMKKPTGTEATRADKKALGLCYAVAVGSGKKYQVSTYSWTGDVKTTDAQPYHDIGGAAALVISIPCLNMHGYAESDAKLSLSQSGTGSLGRQLGSLKGGMLPERIDMRDLLDTANLTTKIVKAYSRIPASWSSR